MTNLIIEIDNLSFSYEKDLTLFKNQSLKIDQGDYVGIIGPNGGGKTTLIRLMMGLLTPDSGKIELLGKRPEEAYRQIGYVPQHAQLDKLFPVSVLEIVLMGRLFHLPWYGMFRKKDKQAAIEILEQMGLADKRDATFGSLSGGQIQRVLIARALVSNPKILFLDEPTANVDAEAEALIYDILKSLQGEMTILMVTHDLEAAFDQVDKICVIDKEITCYRPEEMCHHYTVGLYHKKIQSNFKAKGKNDVS